MSLQFAPSGMMPTRHRFGGSTRPFALRGGIASGYAANVFRGDPVKMVTTGTYQLAAPGDAISAVFAGWLPEDGGVYNVGRYWISGSTYTKVPNFEFWPIEDVLFAIQGVGVIAQSALGDAADIVAGTGNTRSGQSGCYLDSANLAGAAASAQLKIIDKDLRLGNDWGDAFTRVLVLVNEINLGRVPGNAI